MNVFRKYQNNKPDMHCGGKLFDHGVKSSPAQWVFGLEVEVEVWVWDPLKSYEKQEILAFVVEFCA